MAWLGKHLQFNKMEDWYKVTSTDFIKNGGKTLLNRFEGSPPKVITSVFPDHKWYMWKFGTVPMRYWEERENQKKYLEWLGVQLSFTSMDDWCIFTFHISFFLIYYYMM